MKKVAIVCASLSLGACATVSTPSHTMATTFDPSEVSWFAAKGNNTIEGNAVLRTVGGEVRTCAGLQALIWPVSRYAVERVTTIYGTPNGGYARTMPQFDRTDPSYTTASRSTTCDSQGNFKFTDLPDGEYYVQSIVTWGVPMGYYGIVNQQGGGIAQRISLHGGETKSVVLTAN